MLASNRILEKLGEAPRITLGTTGTPCMHRVRGVRQVVLQHSGETAIWDRTRQLFLAHPMGAPQPNLTCSIGWRILLHPPRIIRWIEQHNKARRFIRGRHHNRGNYRWLQHWTNWTGRQGSNWRRGKIDPTIGISTKDLRTINRCQLYLQVFFLSYIATLKGDAIAPWLLSGTISETRTSRWKWPIQQKPPKAAWKMWATVLQETFGNGNSLDVPMGSWLMDNNRQNNKWWLDPHSRSLYQYTKHKLIWYTAINYGRLRFHTAGTETLPPNYPSHRVEISKRSRYLEITVKTQIASREEEYSERLHEYTSEFSPAFFELPRHVQHLIGLIPDVITPPVYQEVKFMDIIVATDGSVLFGVGSHGWIIATRDKQILLSGGGPDDGPAHLVPSYRSELGSIVTGMAALGTLFRSGWINTRSVRFLCGNESAVLAAKIPITDSIFFNTKGDWNLIATVHDLLDKWCSDMNIKFLWVKGHANLLNRPLSRDERLHMVVDQQAEKTINDARGPTAARPSCSQWDIEIASISLRGEKLTSQYKDKLNTQLHEKSLTTFIKKGNLGPNKHLRQSTGVHVVPLLKDCPKPDKSTYPKHASTTGIQAQYIKHYLKKKDHAVFVTMWRKIGNIS
jgi:hypothetical protein